MISISNELAEILGLLCAEGSHIIAYSSYWENYNGKKRYRKNKKSERIEFYNKDKVLLKRYKNLIYLEFGHKSNITKHGKINLIKKDIITKILSYTSLGHLNWFVPNMMFNASNESKIAFIRGYFDGDGTASGIIRFFSTNKKGLEGVSLLLESLGFKNKVNGPYIKVNRANMKPFF